jgi:hypothetical protein
MIEKQLDTLAHPYRTRVELDQRRGGQKLVLAGLADIGRAVFVVHNKELKQLGFMAHRTFGGNAREKLGHHGNSHYHPLNNEVVESMT